MSFWGKGKRPDPPKIRVERIQDAPKPLPISSSKTARTPAANQPRIAKRRPVLPPATPSSPRSDSSDSVRLQPRKTNSVRRRSPMIRRVESDSSDDDSSASYDVTHAHKRNKTTGGVLDVKRRFRSVQLFSEVDNVNLVHAAQIANLTRRFAPAFNASPEEIHGELQYPGSSTRERYEFVHLKNDFDPIGEICDVAQATVNFFLTPEQAEPFRDPSGVLRKLERARNTSNLGGFKSALESYNLIVEKLRQEKIISRNINDMHDMPFELVKRILRQTYDRAVSPNVDLLKKYENGTDYIYGELKSLFVFDILVETRITSDQVFVDLGSGVANVVLQAALQIGCECWGGEIMENACALAEAQKIEMEARCRLWGLALGPVHLEKGDFMDNSNIRDALKRADVVLVNNEVFTPSLNNDLVNLFLDLKDGCQIVSLKSFVPHNHKITSYNLNNPVNLLEVEQRVYSSQSVSWKDEGGHYFIATKDSKKLESYAHLS